MMSSENRFTLFGIMAERLAGQRGYAERANLSGKVTVKSGTIF